MICTQNGQPGLSGRRTEPKTGVKLSKRPKTAKKQNNAKLEIANEENQATIKQMAKNAERLNELTDQLGQDLRKAEAYGDELRNTLNKHNLTHLANKKPGMIEKRMQNATDKLWDDLESVTSNSTTD